jgi:hypothetical protein
MIKCQRLITRIISQRNRPANSVQSVQRSKIFLITSNISRLGFGNSYSYSSQYWYTLQTHCRPPWFIGCFNLHPSYNSWTHRLLFLNKLRPSSRVFLKDVEEAPVIHFMGISRQRVEAVRQQEKLRWVYDSRAENRHRGVLTFVSFVKSKRQRERP